MGFGRSQRALPGETQTGNANLLAFVNDGCLDNGVAAPLRRPAAAQRRAARARPPRAGLLPVPHGPRPAALAARAVRHGARRPQRPAAARRRGRPAGEGEPDRGGHLRGPVVRPPLPPRPGAGLDGDPRVRPAVGQPVRDVPDLGAGAAQRAVPGELDRVGRPGPGPPRSRRSGSWSRSCARRAVTLAAPGGLDWWADAPAPSAPALCSDGYRRARVLPPAPAWTTATGHGRADHAGGTHHAGSARSTPPSRPGSPRSPQNTAAGPGGTDLPRRARPGRSRRRPRRAPPSRARCRSGWNPR